MNCNRAFLSLLLTAILGAGCAGVRQPLVEELATGKVVEEFTRVERSGRRDGDRLPAEIRLQGPDSLLILSLQLRVGVPTTLLQGSYAWQRAAGNLQGNVRERSITFLGGQSDHPSLGGVFELLDPAGAPSFKVVVPTGEVTPR